MFDEWKQAWRQAVDNFQREAAGDDGAPPRIRAMERELASAGGALHRLDEEIRRTRRELEKEREAEVVCRRREQLARDAGDEETVRVAVEFAARHHEVAAVLERKVAVLEDERALFARDVETMRGIVNSAAPAAQAGTASFNGTATPERDQQDHTFSRLERDARERAAEERLEELKRRMRG